MHNFLFLNDTEGDYHFGCSCTSRLIRERLLEHGHCDSFGVLEVWSTDIPPVSEWDHVDAFRKWETEHAELSNKLHKCDTIVANGEGTILLWEGRKGTQALLFLLYAAKIHLGKRCVLINHSSFPFLSLYTLSKRIATPTVATVYQKVYSVLDFCAVRDMRSLAILNFLGCKNVQLAFDCLTLYVQKHFHPQSPSGSGHYVLISGGTEMNAQWKAFSTQVLPAFHRLSKKIFFLLAETPFRTAEDDLLLLEKIETYNASWRFGRHKIGTIVAKNPQEWLEAIHKARFFASGRFHHSLAAFSLHVPFLTMEAHSPKNQVVQDIAPASYVEWDGLSTTVIREKLKAILASPQQDASGIRLMAERNFDFLKALPD